MRQLLIFEGLDASGKSTQAKLLAEFLRKTGKCVLLRSHPSQDNVFGSITKRYLFREGRSAHIIAAFFYILDIFRSILRFIWRDYDFIIFVRYLMGAAYLPKPLHRFAFHFFSKIVPKPTQVYYIDVTPEIAYSRIRKNRTQFEMFEALDRLRKIYEKASELRIIGDWISIAGNMSIEETHSNILSHMKYP